MKLDELQEGMEYAVHRTSVANSRWSTPCRARLSQIAYQHDGRRKYRICVVTLLEDSEWLDGGEPQRAGTTLRIDARNVWRPWVLQAQLNEQKRQIEEAREVNTTAMRQALSQLGLHDERYVRTNADPAAYDVTVSVAELSKIAVAVVELERLLYGWLNGGSDRGTPADRALYVWCEAHDFSNVTG